MPSIMANQYGLLTCPNDIFLLILEQCEQSSVHKLSLTSKTVRAKCLPELYREVDLSSHNLGRFPANEDKFRIEQWSNMDDLNRPESLLSQQRSFLRTITKYPKYAAYVRSLSWTLIWYDQYEEQVLTEIDYQIWNVFSRLERVEKLDLAALPQDKPLEQYTRQIPSVLFPLVKELRLTGWMTHKFVANIFDSSNLSELRILSLDALQEEGKLPDGSPMPEEINTGYWYSDWRAKLCKSRMTDSASTERDFGVIFPGPMWLPFLPLIGKLASLQRLEIRIPPFEEARMGEDCPEYESYISVMAELVESVAQHLEKLVIDYSRRKRMGTANSSNSSGRSYVLTIQRHRLRHSETILKSLCSSLWSNDGWKWKALRSVCLKGFLQAAEIEIPYEGVEIQGIRSKIDDALSSKGVVLEWSDDSPRPGFLFLGHDHGVSETAIEQFDRSVEQLEQA
jgi:hypothetical protein